MSDVCHGTDNGQQGLKAGLAAISAQVAYPCRLIEKKALVRLLWQVHDVGLVCLFDDRL